MNINTKKVVYLQLFLVGYPIWKEDQEERLPSLGGKTRNTRDVLKGNGIEVFKDKTGLERWLCS